MLNVSILQQPDYVSCGPTCLQALYQYYNDDLSIQQIINEIPVNQRNSVYGYGINPLPFTETSVLPSKRLTALQDWMGLQDSVLKKEIHSYFLIDPPKWLILTPQYPPEDPFISQFVSSNYRQVYSNTNYTLYELTISE